MFGIKKGKKPGRNLIWIVLCILLTIAFAAVLYQNYEDQKAESQRLSELASGESKGIDDYESVKKHAEELSGEGSTEEETDSQDNSENSVSESESSGAEAEENSVTSTNEEASAESTGVSDALTETAGISCWGDDLTDETESETCSYMSVLQKLLDDNGYDLTVANKTIQRGGTLSVMKMAGVSDEILQEYISSHTQAANGASLNVTETGIRDLTEEQTDRYEKDYIPVIFMGFYGGWSQDVTELCDQQQYILDTFTDQTRYIIVAVRPIDGSVTAADLDTAMSQRWGEHYIAYSSLTTDYVTTQSGQQAIAEAIFQKLQDLGYITKS